MTDTHTHTQTDRQTDASDLIICPMLCYSNGTDKKRKTDVECRPRPHDLW